MALLPLLLCLPFLHGATPSPPERGTAWESPLPQNRYGQAASPSPRPTSPLTPSPPRASSRSSLEADPVEASLTRMAALQAAIALKEWRNAEQEAKGLRSSLGRWVEASLPGSQRTRLLHALGAVPALEISLSRRQLAQANEQALSLTLTLITVSAALSPPAGGGGGRPAATPEDSAVQHLRAGYLPTVRAYVALLHDDPQAAKGQLALVGLHLNEARRAAPGKIFKRRLDDLIRRRWRLSSQLGEPGSARRLSIELFRSYAQAIHAVGHHAAQHERPPAKAK
ncbi:MAG: hypothetical protein VKP62_01615 [Candidatus Sericytochromatia bacterium]|nr:hypothetical protein [Candidatus Sericytochromatia bacterium]